MNSSFSLPPFPLMSMVYEGITFYLLDLSVFSSSSVNCLTCYDCCLQYLLTHRSFCLLYLCLFLSAEAHWHFVWSVPTHRLSKSSHMLMMGTSISVRFSGLCIIQGKKPSEINGMFYVIVYWVLLHI